MKVCPSCGYVVLNNDIITCPNCIYRSTMKCVDNESKDNIASYQKAYEDWEAVYECIGYPPDNTYKPRSEVEDRLATERIERELREGVKPKNVPKCPTCGSTNLRRISTASKAVNTALFGLFGTKRHKTFRCDNCGYEW